MDFAASVVFSHLHFTQLYKMNSNDPHDHHRRWATLKPPPSNQQASKSGNSTAIPDSLAHMDISTDSVKGAGQLSKSSHSHDAHSLGSSNVSASPSEIKTVQQQFESDKMICQHGDTNGADSNSVPFPMVMTDMMVQEPSPIPFNDSRLSVAARAECYEELKKRTRPPLESGTYNAEIAQLCYPPPPGIIQPYHAVIGDQHAKKPPRLTAGTMILRQVRCWYQENRQNHLYQSAKELHDAAMHYYFKIMKQTFGEYFPSDRPAQEETILVYCGNPQYPLKVFKPERVKTTKKFIYSHQADLQKTNAYKFGVANLPTATLEYFQAWSGPPPLKNQVEDYATRLKILEDTIGELPAPQRRTFVLYLEFTKSLLDQEKEGCPLATLGLTKTNLNTSLRDLWQELSGS